MLPHASIADAHHIPVQSFVGVFLHVEFAGAAGVAAAAPEWGAGAGGFSGDQLQTTAGTGGGGEVTTRGKGEQCAGSLRGKGGDQSKHSLTVDQCDATDLGEFNGLFAEG